MKKIVIDNIKIVASHPKVQESIVNAMFSGCEVGTDLFEYLEGDRKKFPKFICEKIWGPEFPEAESYEEEREQLRKLEAMGTLCNSDKPHEVICLLLKTVKEELFYK